MKSSRRHGHVLPAHGAGLLVGIGLGAAVWSGSAVASADTGTPDNSPRPSTSAAKSADRTSARNPVRARPAHTAKPSAVERRTARAARRAAKEAPAKEAPAVGAAASATPVIARVVRPRAAAGLSAVAAPPQPASVSAPQGASVNPDAMPPKPYPHGIWISLASTVLGVAQTTLRAVSIAGYMGPTPSTLNQTVALNGFDLVPSSTELVTSFYGQWAYWPGGPTLIQGKQQYTVVDPATKQSAGTFDALVSTGSPFNIRSKYVELLVTDNDATNVGTGPGQVPPVGSLIATFNLIAGFGWTYSALASSPKDVVSFALTTPFGNIPLPFPFDAAKGIADHTVDDQPIRLGNGYSIAPADPAAETFVGTSGFLPYYKSLTGHQVFDLRDPSGTTVGSFEGVFTPTADVMGVNTEAILVTRVIDGTSGTGVGEVPPVGSVFNVMYEGSESKYVLYSALPSPSGDVVSVIRMNDGQMSNVRTFPLNRLDAADPPPVRRIPGADGYSYLPTSDLVPVGVNGLPPREVQIQGYQQFGVYDANGVQRGSFDADVATQSDMFGIYSQALLVTKVTGGTAGTDPGDVPPVGSMVNVVYFGNSGFGTYYSARPTADGAKVTFKFLTPLIDIPTWSTYDATAGLGRVELFDPFV